MPVPIKSEQVSKLIGIRTIGAAHIFACVGFPVVPVNYVAPLELEILGIASL